MNIKSLLNQQYKIPHKDEALMCDITSHTVVNKPTI